MPLSIALTSSGIFTSEAFLAALISFCISTLVAALDDLVAAAFLAASLAVFLAAAVSALTTPLVMPFANMFGHDTMKNFTYCIQTMQTDFMGPFLAPSNYTNAVAAVNIKTSVKNNTNIMGMFAYIRNTVMNNFSGLYNVFGSLGLILQYMVGKLNCLVDYQVPRLGTRLRMLYC